MTKNAYSEKNTRKDPQYPHFAASTMATKVLIDPARYGLHNVCASGGGAC